MQHFVSLTRWQHTQQKTYKTRLDIGYVGIRDQWKEADITRTSETLTICGHPVMERWEDGYMETLARIATARGGHILEVGYGMGISAGYIQRHDIKKHTIIEANQGVYRRAREDMKHARVPKEFLVGFWEDITCRLPSEDFDGILFDTYPLSAPEIHRNHFPFFPEAFRLLKPDGILTYYSDEVTDFSAEHRNALLSAGFSVIDKIVCPVAPPPDCQYWNHPTIVAPIIMK